MIGYQSHQCPHLERVQAHQKRSHILLNIQVFPQSFIPLVKMLHSMREDDLQEEIQIGAKLTDI